MRRFELTIGIVVLCGLTLVGLLAANLGAAAIFIVQVEQWLSGYPTTQPPITEGQITTDDWRDFRAGSRKFTNILLEKFPPGTREAVLQTTLQQQGFKFPEPRPADCKTMEEATRLRWSGPICAPWDPNKTLEYRWGNAVCVNFLTVLWSANDRGEIAHIDGMYGHACL